MSALAFVTPESLLSSPSTAALQWPQLMPSTFSVFSVIVSLLSPLSSLELQEPLYGGGELLYLLVSIFAVLDGLPDAVLDVVLEQYGADLLQRRDDAGDLGEYVYAVGLLIPHPLHAAHLALYPPEAVLEELPVPGLYVAVGGPLRLASLRRVHH